jgi:NADH-quinone oxidoreductase subunit J
MLLRNLVHCALALAVTFTGLAGLYLQLNAPFAGFAQLLVYVGAVSIIIVFAILLTRSGGSASKPLFMSRSWVGLLLAAGTFVLLAAALLSSRNVSDQTAAAPEPTVRQIGDVLMTRYILPLEVLGLLLTAALIGAVVLAMREKDGP